MDACDDMEVQDADGMIMNVLENRGINYTVDAKKHICTCGLWQMSGIPCMHTCKCIMAIGWKDEDFVNPMLKNDNYINLYSVEMQNVLDQNCGLRGV